MTVKWLEVELYDTAISHSMSGTIVGAIVDINTTRRTIDIETEIGRYEEVPMDWVIEVEKA